MTTNKTIYIIRHGQTDYNLRGIVQGSGIDSDLNHTGRQQARDFHAAYKHIPFDHIYTSELKRTIQSVQPFLEEGNSYTALPELNEINWGVFEGLETTPESKAEFNRIIDAWRNGELHIPIEAGESPIDMFTRQKMGWQKILDASHNHILICMHGRAMRSFLSLILDTPLCEMDQYPHSNLCLYKLEWGSENKLQLSERNSTSHLTTPS